MNSPTTCPCCGVVVMPSALSYDFDGETVASLTREVAYLRATVARLRGAPAPRVSPEQDEHVHVESDERVETRPVLSAVAAAS